MTISTGISPYLASLLIEEGCAIEIVIDGKRYLFQRNPGLHYFNFRKWRMTEQYTISNDQRNRVYCVSGQSPKMYTTAEYKNFLNDAKTIEAVPPVGSTYKTHQLQVIQRDIRRIIKILKAFPTSNDEQLADRNDTTHI